MLTSPAIFTRDASVRAAFARLLGKTLGLRWFAARNLPMLALARPSVVAQSDTTVCVRIPMCRRNRSFRGALAFGPVLMGAECAAGYVFFDAINTRRPGVGFVVTRCESELRRAIKTSGRFLASVDRPAVEYLDAVCASGRPVTVPVHVQDFDDEDQLCATFTFDVRLQPPRGSEGRRGAGDQGPS